MGLSTISEKDFLKKMENKIQINVNKWVQAETNLLQFHKMTGRDYLSYITKVTAKGGSVEGLNKGDYILVSNLFTYLL